MAGTSSPTTSPTAPAALAAPSQFHHFSGTPYSLIGSTTHFARKNTDAAENPTITAATKVTTVCDMGKPFSNVPVTPLTRHPPQM
ncbi:hypothetical protein GCM10010171_51290 [Actinokineospora fastidiosa]|uniref:Uncharacterized protein n=1 Tax=Actinokineospora fastidiosa TaxID=1816 RepID=A0A918LHX6_9PSEU|nr:hypothetical protein GCM10010171_51290 [Actinokineospora fastidiosa]